MSRHEWCVECWRYIFRHYVMHLTGKWRSILISVVLCNMLMWGLTFTFSQPKPTFCRLICTIRDMRLSTASSSMIYASHMINFPRPNLRSIFFVAPISSPSCLFYRTTTFVLLNLLFRPSSITSMLLFLHSKFLGNPIMHYHAQHLVIPKQLQSVKQNRGVQ